MNIPHSTFVATCAVSAVFQTFLLLKSDVEISFWYYTAWLFFTVSALYSYHPTTLWKQKSTIGAGLLAVVFFGLFVQRLVGEHFARFYEVVPVFLATLAVGTGYFLLPEKATLRFKTYMKPIAVSYSWAAACAWIPLLLLNSHDLLFNILVASEKFFFIMPLALAYDILDVERDRKIGPDTLPVKFGIPYTKTVAYISIGTAYICLIAMLRFGYIGYWLVGFLSLNTLLTAYFIKQTSINPFFQKRRIDALIILQCLIVCLNVLVQSW